MNFVHLTVEDWEIRIEKLRTNSFIKKNIPNFVVDSNRNSGIYNEKCKLNKLFRKYKQHADKEFKFKTNPKVLRKKTNLKDYNF